MIHAAYSLPALPVTSREGQEENHSHPTYSLPETPPHGGQREGKRRGCGNTLPDSTEGQGSETETGRET